jgi:hypothetical protein
MDFILVSNVYMCLYIHIHNINRLDMSYDLEVRSRGERGIAAQVGNIAHPFWHNLMVASAV